jgi:hypothetical protein
MDVFGFAKSRKCGHRISRFFEGLREQLREEFVLVAGIFTDKRERAPKTSSGSGSLGRVNVYIDEEALILRDTPGVLGPLLEGFFGFGRLWDGQPIPGLFFRNGTSCGASRRLSPSRPVEEDLPTEARMRTMPAKVSLAVIAASWFGEL